MKTIVPRFFPKPQLQQLLDQLRQRGYCTVGPTIDQEAIVYSEIQSIEQLPRGWTDEQAPGHYRLRECSSDRWFNFAVGPHSWKKFLFPPHSKLLSAQKTDQGWTFIPVAEDSTRFALIGVRACELAAMKIQDRVFMDPPHQDHLYRKRREGLFIVAVNCTQAASTCFCTSMKTGPRCEQGFDIALTEIDTGFVCEIASDPGREIVDNVSTTDASVEQIRAGESARQQAVDQIQRHFATDDLPGLLLNNLNHPQWKAVGERCLSCTNCTMVCPTCFCSSVTDVRDLNQEAVDRVRTWDSCFNPDFSYVGGGLIRHDTASRYRQWLTHKLDSWHSQFGTSGCVGCGRCITWCPVGIDLTEEVEAIRKDPGP